MKPKKLPSKSRRHWMTLAVLLASAACARAQSSDAIIDKLVDKGILTVKEANELREESDKNFTQAYSVKNGLPDWVNSLKFNGDFRVRYEEFFSDARFASGGATNQNPARTRFRYRLRFGMTAMMLDNLEAGFRLTSGDTVSGFSSSTGSPLSGNSTMQDNGSKKFVYFDLAYGRWYALNGPEWTATVTAGKMENPFVFDGMVFDPDYTPEGGSLQFGYHLNDQHSFKLNTGAFVLDEFGAASQDPYMLGAQLRWDAAWNTKWASTLGLSILSIQNARELTNSVVPNVNRGNTRNASLALTYPFNPWVVDGAITYTASTFPLYKGPFPIKFSGEYMENPAAPSSADNHGWNAGVLFGKSGKKGTWEILYNYEWLGANAWYEEVVDDDFGAIYPGVVAVPAVDSPPNSGAGGGYGSGTNIKGHTIRFAYSPTDSVTLAMKLFLTEVINPFPAASGTKTETARLQVDANWKF